MEHWLLDFLILLSGLQITPNNAECCGQAKIVSKNDAGIFSNKAYWNRAPRREERMNENKKKLPLFPETLIAKMGSTFTPSARDPFGGKAIKIDGVELLGPEDQDNLRKALIRHTLSGGGEEDLENLVFSTIPDGAKLVLKSVQVIPTDMDGDPIENGEEDDIHWHISLVNATNNPSERLENPGGRYEDKFLKDLRSAGSQYREKYDSYGSKAREKTKDKKLWKGTDKNKYEKNVHTDTDGVENTDYKGKEDELTVYKHSKSGKDGKEGGRYKNANKKNKGRRVTGFKRVYHKEEYQRTEHFYDDEHAKKLAENYGFEHTEKNKKQAVEDDTKKYNGTKVEYVDGDKLTKEKGTRHGWDHGQKRIYNEVDRNKEGENYNKSYKKYIDNDPHYRHPNHKYYTSHSNPRKYKSKKVAQRPNLSAELETNLVGDIRKEAKDLDETEEDEENPTAAPHYFYNRRNLKKKFTKLRESNGNKLNENDEKRIFYSPRSHPEAKKHNYRKKKKRLRMPPSSEETFIPVTSNPYAPNFGPSFNLNKKRKKYNYPKSYKNDLFHVSHAKLINETVELVEPSTTPVPWKQEVKNPRSRLPSVYSTMFKVTPTKKLLGSGFRNNDFYDDTVIKGDVNLVHAGKHFYSTAPPLQLERRKKRPLGRPFLRRIPMIKHSPSMLPNPPILRPPRKHFFRSETKYLKPSPVITRYTHPSPKDPFPWDFPSSAFPWRTFDSPSILLPPHDRLHRKDSYMMTGEERKKLKRKKKPRKKVKVNEHDTIPSAVDFKQGVPPFMNGLMDTVSSFFGKMG